MVVEGAGMTKTVQGDSQKIAEDTGARVGDVVTVAAVEAILGVATGDGMCVVAGGLESSSPSFSLSFTCYCNLFTGRLFDGSSVIQALSCLTRRMLLHKSNRTRFAVRNTRQVR